MTNKDYLITLDTQIGTLADYEELNDRKSVTVMNRSEAMSFFKDRLSDREE
jgi:hypothetical protein